MQAEIKIKSELETAKVDPKMPFRSAAGATRPLARKEPVRRKPVARRTAELPPSSDKSSDRPPGTSRFKQGARGISKATFNGDNRRFPMDNPEEQMTRFPMDNPEEGKHDRDGQLLLATSETCSLQKS